MPRTKALLALAVAGTVTGCSLAPVYKTPQAPLPAQYEQARASAPASRLAPDWWRAFNDPTLDALQQQLEQASPDLASAVARYDAARAAAGLLSAARGPSLGASASSLDQRQSDDKPLRSTTQPAYYGGKTLTFDLAFDLDLWGRLRNAAAAGQARAQASGDDLAAARLDLQRQLTALYLQLRGMDAREAILRASLDDYRQALDLTTNRFEGQIASELDVARARHQLASASADLDETHAQRALLRHAIATLVGAPASGFVLPASTATLALPQVPADLPSALLQRRPDIAAAERRVFAANAGIGVARAAWFPNLSLTALVGGMTSGDADLLSQGNRYFALGPLASLPLLDQGKRKAARLQAQAEFDAASAQYRGTVLKAIGQVEDNLTLVRELATEASHEQDAVDAATRAEQIAQDRYTGGAVSYLDVVSAQTDARQAQLGLQAITTRRLQASAALMAALGGGWDGGAGAPAKDG